MNPNLSCCGLVCEGCPVYWATRETDPRRKQRIREACVRTLEEQFDVEKNIAEITDCDGCGTDGRLFSGAGDCAVRKCCRQRSLKTCAHCDDYPCESLIPLLKENPSQKSRLDILRAVR